MKKVNEKGQAADNSAGGIKEERLKALKGNYSSPEFVDFTLKEVMPGECSDMASAYAGSVTKTGNVITAASLYDGE